MISLLYSIFHYGEQKKNKKTFLLTTLFLLPFWLTLYEIYLFWLWIVSRRKSLFLFLWPIFLLSNNIFLSISVTPLDTKTLSTIYLNIIYLNTVGEALFYCNIILFVFRVYIHDRPSYVNVRFVTWFFNLILWVYDILSSSFIFSFRFLNFCFVDIFLNRESGGRWLLTDEVSLASWEYSCAKSKIIINTYHKLTT